MTTGTRFPPCRQCARPILCEPGETRAVCPSCEGLDCPPEELKESVYPRYEARETEGEVRLGYYAGGEWRAWRRMESLAAAKAWIREYQ